MKTNLKLTNFILNQKMGHMTNTQISDAIYAQPKYHKYSYAQIYRLVVKIVTDYSAR